MDINDLAEDTTHALLVEAWARNDVEVPGEARSNWIFTSSGRTHRSNNHNIRDLLQLVPLVSVVIPLFMVHPLSKQLNRRLSTLVFNGWHIHIIYVDDQLFVICRPQVPPLLFLEFVFNLLLGEVCA